MDAKGNQFTQSSTKSRMNFLAQNVKHGNAGMHFDKNPIHSIQI